jgi:hypothetical protein
MTTTASRVAFYLRVSEAGTIAALVLCVALPLGASSFLTLPLGFLLIGALAVLFFSGQQDEFIRGLWCRAASAAFLSVIAVDVFGDFAIGLADGVRDASGAAPHSSARTPLGTYAGDVGILVFYLRFQMARLGAL